MFEPYEREYRIKQSRERFRQWWSKTSSQKSIFSQGISKPAIRILVSCEGVKLLSNFIYEGTRGALKVFLENVIREWTL